MNVYSMCVLIPETSSDIGGMLLRVNDETLQTQADFTSDNALNIEGSSVYYGGVPVTVNVQR